MVSIVPPLPHESLRVGGVIKPYERIHAVAGFSGGIGSLILPLNLK